MNHTAWLRSALSSPWWKLPDDHIRLALALVAMSDDSGRVDTTYDHLVMACRMPRVSIWRAILALEAAGFCIKQASSGRGGGTVLVITDLERMEHLAVVEETASGQPVPGTGSWNEWNESANMAITTDDRCGKALQPWPPGTEKVDGLERKLPITPEIRPDASRASDLDLQRSSGSGSESSLRSPDSQDLTRSEIQKVPRGPRRIDPGKVPPRAWAAADYLRTQVMAQNAAAMVGTKPWDGETGLRLAWANSFRLLHAQLHKALKNANPDATEADAWAEIARTVHWLFNGQSVNAKFVIESPDSLREKWDRVQAVRRNNSQKPARGADGRPDTMSTTTFKRALPGEL